MKKKVLLILIIIGITGCKNINLKNDDYQNQYNNQEENNIINEIIKEEISDGDNKANSSTENNISTNNSSSNITNNSSFNNGNANNNDNDNDNFNSTVNNNNNSNSTNDSNSNNINDNNSPKNSITVKRIWMDNPGVKLNVGDKITIYVEVEFKNKPGSIVLWFASKSNPNSIKSTTISPSTSNDNIYSLTLTIDEKMQPGDWEGTWYYISDYYDEYIQQDYNNIEFTINGEENVETTKKLTVKRIWMDNPGVKLNVGDKITIYVEVEFKNKPGSIVLWFASKSNPNSIKSTTISPSTSNDNIYSLTLTIDEKMQPGDWEGTWYYISDYYDEYIQQDYNNIEFTIK